jgi:Uri superfamily endonuclease
MDPTHTLYAIFLEIESNRLIQVGKLGEFLFQRGTYIYVGSAKRHIEKRIERLKRLHKRFRWHFDYLRPFGDITKIITYESSLEECQLSDKLRKDYNGEYPVKGFGSSDCKCRSHLIFVGGN